ncbi:rod shape-determining protein MreD [Clostridium acetireducens DSM 10703]|jgi:rod shape-determining protein MreD|uniref:Rod shape-determining protein MreD n=1 Tax=Clostridium acetireducens DSM 10703 TaxID=1121290 RepID=A0A1E8F1A8_9CLOT|nr:rod shape-determining protein MreD [Clostridium acetireducens]OFI07228.1 rod shape-determining protein MreD [Clostridium acetireducens DSM 10703]
MRKVFILGGLSILFSILDNTCVPFFAIKGFYPSLLFVFVICYSIINESWEGIWIGVTAGLLQDIYFNSSFGMNLFTNMIIGIIAGYIGKNIFKQKGLIPIVACFFLSILKGLLILVILYINKISISFASIFFSSIYNMIIGIFMYKFMYKLCEKPYMQRKWKF